MAHDEAQGCCACATDQQDLTPKVQLPSLHVRTPSPPYIRPSTPGTSPTPGRRPTPLCSPAATSLSSVGLRKSSSTPPPAAVAPAANAAAAAPAKPPTGGGGAAPAGPSGAREPGPLARDRIGSGSKWEPLWARKVVEAAAAALCSVRSRAPSAAGAAAASKAGSPTEGDAAAEVQPLQQPPILPPCRTGSGNDMQPPGAAALPSSLDSSSSTPTAFPVATLLSHSLLQALNSPNAPCSPHVLPPGWITATWPTAEQLQELQEQQQEEEEGHDRTTPTHPAAPAAEVAPALPHGLGLLEMVQACTASGWSAEGLQHQLVQLVSSQPGLSVEDVAALLLMHVPQDGGTAATGPPAKAATQPDLYPAVSAAAAAAAATGTTSNRSSSTSIGSCALSSGSLPLRSSSGQLSSRHSGPLPANGTGQPPRANSSELAWVESTGASAGDCLSSSGKPPVHSTLPHGPAAPAAAPKQTLEQLPRGATPVLPGLMNHAPMGDRGAHAAATPWDISHLIGLLEQQQQQQQQQQQVGLGKRHSPGPTQQQQPQQQRQLADRGLAGLCEGSLHGGRQLLEWMGQLQQQQEQAQRQLPLPLPHNLDALHSLRVHAPPPSRVCMPR